MCCESQGSVYVHDVAPLLYDQCLGSSNGDGCLGEDYSHTDPQLWLNSLTQTLPLFTLASAPEIKLQTSISFFTTLLWIVKVFPFVQSWAGCDGNMCVCGHSGSYSLRRSHIMIQYYFCFVFCYPAMLKAVVTSAQTVIFCLSFLNTHTYFNNLYKCFDFFFFFE